MYICSSTFKIPCQLRNIKPKFLHCLIGPTKRPLHTWPDLFSLFSQGHHLGAVTIRCCPCMTELVNNTSYSHYFTTNISILFILVCVVSCCCQILYIFTVFLTVALGIVTFHYRDSAEIGGKTGKEFYQVSISLLTSVWTQSIMFPFLVWFQLFTLIHERISKNWSPTLFPPY